MKNDSYSYLSYISQFSQNSQFSHKKNKRKTMPQIKTLYVSDMDGTLLNQSSVLSETTIKKLNSLIERGAMFTVATARTPATVVDLMKRVNANLPFIVMAGCAMWDNKKQEYASARTICRNDIQKFINIFEHHGNTPFLYYKHGNQIIVRHSNHLSEDEHEFIDPRVTGPLKKLITTDKLSAEDSTDELMLIFSMGKFRDLRAIADDIDSEGISCTYNCYHDIFNDELGFIDLYTRGTTKAEAIKELAAKVGAERIVVFGDNLNDIPMMQIADHSVAVENAYDEVKAASDEVIGTNEDDSVVKWIEADFNNLSNSK